jgi:hypothetical protein
VVVGAKLYLSAVGTVNIINIMEHRGKMMHDGSDVQHGSSSSLPSWQ